METLRKAIDKLPVLLKAHIYEPSIDAVAEISFKAGYDQALQDNAIKGWWVTKTDLRGWNLLVIVTAQQTEKSVE